MLNPGFILNDRYKIKEIIGQGGLSVVYRAIDLEANDAVRAVKEISKKRKAIIHSAKQESQLIKEFYEHDVNNFFPNIIQSIEDNDSLYIVMDYIDGVAMNTLLKTGAFSKKQIIDYGKDICSVINYLHSYGKIYSDMKPDNIMVINKKTAPSDLEKSQKKSTLKLIDFGAVVQTESGTPVQYTPEYAAPEQFREEKLDIRTDIFNIGATIFHMATGNKPLPVFDDERNFRSSCERFIFSGNSSKISSYLKKIILKCVDDNPLKRYNNCKELYSDLVKADKLFYIKLTAASAAVTVAAAALCIFSYGNFNHSAQQTYNEYIEAFSNASDYQKKITYIKKAVLLQPENPTAYLDLISYMTQDSVLTEKESDDLTTIISSENEKKLKNSDDYEAITCSIGKAYWYYYNKNSTGLLDINSDINAPARAQTSTNWFGKSLTEKYQIKDPIQYELAEVYTDIGVFHANIKQKVLEANDAPMYPTYWQNLNRLLDIIARDKNDTEIVLLETYRFALRSDMIYVYKFASGNIATKEDQINFINTVKKGTDQIHTTTDITQNLQSEISHDISELEKVVDSAYSRSEE